MKNYHISIRITLPYHVYEEHDWWIDAFSSVTAIHDAISRTEREMLFVRRKEDYEISDIRVMEIEEAE